MFEEYCLCRLNGVCVKPTLEFMWPIYREVVEKEMARAGDKFSGYLKGLPWAYRKLPEIERLVALSGVPYSPTKNSICGVCL